MRRNGMFGVLQRLRNSRYPDIHLGSTECRVSRLPVWPRAMTKARDLGNLQSIATALAAGRGYPRRSRA